MIFDPDLFFNSHLQQISRTTFFHLCKISMSFIKRYRLDFCNSLLSGSSGKSLKTCPNAAARVLTRTRRRNVIISHFQFWRQKPSVRSRVDFKPSFTIKLIVRAGQAFLRPALSNAAVGLECRGTHDTRSFSFQLLFPLLPPYHVK